MRRPGNLVIDMMIVLMNGNDNHNDDDDSYDLMTMVAMT